MKIVNSVTVAVTLSVFWSVASADAEIPGIRVVGQGVDGTLVLDDSVSDLATLSSPGLFMIGNETSEGAPTLLVIGHIGGFDAKTGILTVSGQRSTLSEHASVIDVPRDINSEINTDNLF